MQKLNLFKFAIIMSIMIVNINCDKPVPDVKPLTPPTAPPPSPPLPVPGVWIVGVNANSDITVESPIDFAILHGYASSIAVTYKWRKISGPTAGVVDNPDSLTTKVSGLVKGVYKFELKVWDNNGDSATDSMTLNVEDATSSNKQIYFWDCYWSCPWTCIINLEDIFSYVSTNPFNVFIRRDSSSTWEQVALDSPGVVNKYRYNISGNNIIIWEVPDITVYDYPEIKIVF